MHEKNDRIKKEYMNYKKLYLSLFLSFLTFSLFAQTGILRGTLIDNETTKKIKNAKVSISDSIYTYSDLDGNFELKTTVGIYSISISMDAYSDLLIQEVEIPNNTVNSLGMIRLTSAAESIGQVKISVKTLKNSEEALLTSKKIAPNFIDGISAASFKKIGDGDAASAMSRVTGVSVEGGKYIFVRGLGDRYTKTTLNSMEIPGLDPDRNTIQMDLFPTNVIDNIIVSKTFTADLPADFTGGVVDISTKDFPEKKNWSLSVGTSYNPDMNLKSNYVTYKGSNTDFLGFDNGQRDIPTGGGNSIPTYIDFISNPNSTKGKKYQEINNGFNRTMGGERRLSPLSFNIGASFANQKKINNTYSLGYQMAFTYKNETEFYENATFNLFAKSPNPEINELTPLEQQTGDYGTNNVLLGGLGTIALKSANHKYKLNVLHIQNGEKKAGNFYFVNTNLGANWEANQYNLEYNQRSLTNILLSGTHVFGRNNWKLDWKISPTRSAIEDPDIRFTRFRIPDNMISTEVGKPERIWRTLTETNIANRIDASKEYKMLRKKSKVNFGLAYTYKQRDFNIQNFQVTVGSTKFNGDPNSIYSESNLISPTNINGVRFDAQFIPINPNEFNASISYAGAYISNETQITPLFKTNIGVRIEKYTQKYSGTNQLGSIVLDNETVLDNMDVFPTVNAIYNISKNQNVRMSFAQTIARPSMKELSYAEILDPITGRTFIGGKAQETTNGGNTVLWDGNLKSTNINNFDIRWESFQKAGDMISIGVYYKHLVNPIEIVQFLADPGSFQPRNVGNANIYGAEFELRQNLSILSNTLKNISFNSNLTLTQSSIAITNSEFLSRTQSARIGQEIKQTRVMAGQAPYIINAGLSYTNPKKTLDFGLFYNLQGPTLQYVGFANNTDVFSVPFHSLNLNANMKLGKMKKFDLGFKVSNILNDKREQIFNAYNASSQYFTRLAPGTTFSLKLSYSI